MECVASPVPLFWWTWVLSCPRHLALSIKDDFWCYVVKRAGGSNSCKCQIQPSQTSTRNRSFPSHLICWTMLADSWEKPVLCLHACRRFRQLFCVVPTGASVRKHHHSKRSHSHCVISESRDLCLTIWFTSIFHLRNRTVQRDDSQVPYIIYYWPFFVKCLEDSVWNPAWIIRKTHLDQHF